MGSTYDSKISSQYPVLKAKTASELVRDMAEKFKPEVWKAMNHKTVEEFTASIHDIPATTFAGLLESDKVNSLDGISEIVSLIRAGVYITPSPIKTVEKERAGKTVKVRVIDAEKVSETQKKIIRVRDAVSGLVTHFDAVLSLADDIRDVKLPKEFDGKTVDFGKLNPKTKSGTKNGNANRPQIVKITQEIIAETVAEADGFAEMVDAAKSLADHLSIVAEC